MTEPILEIRNLDKRYGDVSPADNVSLTVKRGEFFTLLGPSGSGKSTILRIIAGLEQADSGEVLIDGRVVTEIPPWRRGLGMVFQQYANFPHMNVAENIGYALRRKGLSRDAVGKRVAELLRLVGLRGFENRRVTQLSGGEQQRVAIARALAPQPRMLLLDEPLAALDEKIRREMQDELRSIQRSTGTTFVYVTHDQEEALTMSDRIAVLNHGRCVQCNAPEHVFRHPRTRFVAMFFRGCNVLEVTLAADDGATLNLAGWEFPLPVSPQAPAGPRAIAVRGEALRLADSAQGSDIVLTAQLEAITYRGVYSDYRLSLPDGQKLSAMLPPRHDLAKGEKVKVGIGAADIVFLDDD